MAKNTTSISTIEKSPSKLNSIWAAIIAGCSLMSMGFGAGLYVSNVFNKIEINEINQNQNEQLYNQKKDFDSKIEELIHEKNLLEIENGKLRK